MPAGPGFGSSFHVSMLVIKNLCFLFTPVVDLIINFKNTLRLNYFYINLYSWSVFRATSADQHAANWSMDSDGSDRLVRSSLRSALGDSRIGSV